MPKTEAIANSTGPCFFPPPFSFAFVFLSFTATFFFYKLADTVVCSVFSFISSVFFFFLFFWFTDKFLHACTAHLSMQIKKNERERKKKKKTTDSEKV